MSGSKTGFVLDANPFIEAKNRYYGFDLFPGFWKALLDHHRNGRICSIDRVFDELTGQGDELSDWVDNSVPDTFFKQCQDQAVIDCFQQIVSWVFAEDFTPEARTEFASVADGWVIAFAKVNNLTVVTHEEFAPEAKKRVPMPNVCLEFDVPYVNTYAMLEELKVQFILKTKRAKRK